MHSALAVAAPAAVSELRAQGVLGVGRLRSLAVAVVAIGVSLGCLVAVRSAVGGLNALQLAMFSVGGWALLIANGLSGAYLGGTGTRDVHGIVDHLPLRRVDLAMLPFALGGLRSGILSALLCGIALVAPRSANTPTPLWLSLVVAATLPILPATIVWASTRRQRPYAPAWILLPLTVLISVPMVAEVRLDGLARGCADVLAVPSRALIGTADPRSAGVLVVLGLLGSLALRLRPEPLADDGRGQRPLLATLPLRRTRSSAGGPARGARLGAERARLGAELVLSTAAWGRLTSTALCLVALVGVGVVGASGMEDPTVAVLVGLGSASLLTVGGSVAVGLTPPSLLSWIAALPVDSADLRRGNAIVSGSVGAGLVALGALVTQLAGRPLLSCAVASLMLPLCFALTAEAARHHLGGAARLLIPSVTSPWLLTRPVAGVLLATAFGPAALTWLLGVDLLLAAVAWRLLALPALITGGSR